MPPLLFPWWRCWNATVFIGLPNLKWHSSYSSKLWLRHQYSLFQIFRFRLRSRLMLALQELVQCWLSKVVHWLSLLRSFHIAWATHPLTCMNSMLLRRLLRDGDITYYEENSPLKQIIRARKSWCHKWYKLPTSNTILRNSCVRIWHCLSSREHKLCCWFLISTTSWTLSYLHSSGKHNYIIVTKCQYIEAQTP